ncbi:TadE/TadG family type IV pilus assembly protein [Mesorhizobium sp. CAU 1741]|uniref:TadE/TadG family type IV pilus assembly protein n=1 Tax=Mesorhizobium sp. CAU 1741 TaxID=3140366 RepID=UPI00325BDC87
MKTLVDEVQGRLRSAARAVRALASDRRGVAAVEFAFIAPVLLSLYFVTMEVSQAIETNRKVSRVGSMVADLVTQQSSEVPKDELEAIMKIGSVILQPYNRSEPTITVTAIYLTDENNPDAEVQWSRKMTGTSFGEGPAKDTITSVPDTLKIRNTFLIRVTSELDYEPVITWSAKKEAALGFAAAFDGIGMKETYYLRPRMTERIECKGC